MGGVNLRATETQMEVSLIYFHDKFSHETYDNDIALLLLKEEISYSEAVRPVCLDLSAGSEQKPDSVCHVSGWGKEGESAEQGTQDLMEAEMPLVDRTEC